MKKTIKLDPYEGHLYLYKSKDIRKTYNRIQKEYPDVGPPMLKDDGSIALAVWADSGSSEYWLIFGEDVDLGIIAHECMHISLAIAEYYSIEVSAESEPLAYLHEYLVKNVARYLLG